MNLNEQSIDHLRTASNGGAGMNVAVALILAAIFLQIYTSQWLQNVQLDLCRVSWGGIKNSLARTEAFVWSRSKKLEAVIETFVLETNWTDRR